MWGTDSSLSDGSCHPRTRVLGSRDLFWTCTQARCHAGRLIPVQAGSQASWSAESFADCGSWEDPRPVALMCEGNLNHFSLTLGITATFCWVMVTRSQCVLVIWCDHFPSLLVSQWKLIIFCLTTLLSFCKRFGTNIVNYNSIFVKRLANTSFWKDSELWEDVLQTSFSSTIQQKETMVCILH